MNLRCALFLVPLVVLAFVPDAKSAAPPVARVHPGVPEAVQALLHHGGALVDAGDYRSAFRLYEGGLLILRPALANRPDLQQRIDQALARAKEDLKSSVRATEYRAVLVHIQREAAGTSLHVVKVPRQPAPAFALSKEEQTLLDLTNREREKAGLRPLRADARLFEAARKHSANMASQKQLAHTLDGKGPAERLRDLGYRNFGMGENCAAGQRSPAEAIRSWLDSEGHRRNMLNGTYLEVGLGIATDEDGVRYWTQVFAIPSRP